MTIKARGRYGLTLLCAMATWACSDLIGDTTDRNALEFRAASCGATFDGPELKSHLTEADLDYFARLDALDTDSLPESYDLSDVFELDVSLIGYMLDQTKVETLVKDELLVLGKMGRAVLLALGDSSAPQEVDFRELRRGLYHFYYCYRGLPANLDGFKSIFGDYADWPSFTLEESFPKIYPRRIRQNIELGIYVAETMREGAVYETEIILEGYREDGMLEFLSYMPNGNISSRGEFRAGADFTVGTSPYTCMSCHYNPANATYDIVYPQMTRN